MADPDVEFIGTELGQHGSNIYFREFSVRVDDKVKKSYKLGKFYVVRRNPSQPICIAEFQLIWKNIKDGRKLASAKLYFRPEDTPYGRLGEHGDDELLEADRHVAIYCTEVPRWECGAQDWTTGQFAYETVDAVDSRPFFTSQPTPSTDSNGKETPPICTTEYVKILGFPGYCRYKTCLKLLQSKNHGFSRRMLLAKGALEFKHRNTRVLFSRCKFSHPSIEDNVFTGDLKLPVFKGRPRKRKPSTVTTTVNGKRTKIFGLECDALASERLMGSPDYRLPIDCRERSALKAHLQGIPPLRLEFEQDPDRFLQDVQTFMKQIGSPITKIPKVAFTRVSLFKLFQLVNSYGGYAQVTMNHKWKRVYDALGLATTITSAATCIRRHYERLLLPYEKFLRHRHKLLKEQAAKQQQQQQVPAPVLVPKPSAEEQNITSDVRVESIPANKEQITGSSLEPNLKSPVSVYDFPTAQSRSPSHPYHPSQMIGPHPEYQRVDFNLDAVPKMQNKANILNGHIPKKEQPHLSMEKREEDAPALPLKLVIQRRRGRPPKYLKAQLEELKSLAQKARLGELCAQRAPKRGRKPKSTVLRISVGPDGTIRSQVGNLQLTPSQIKEGDIQRDGVQHESSSAHNGVTYRSDAIPSAEKLSIADGNMHGRVRQQDSRILLPRPPVRHSSGADDPENLPLFRSYKGTQRKCLLDTLLPKIEQNCMLRKDHQTEGTQTSAERGLPKYQHVKDSSRPPEMETNSERCRHRVVEREPCNFSGIKSNHFRPLATSLGKLPSGMQGKMVIAKTIPPTHLIKADGTIMASNPVKVGFGSRLLPGTVVVSNPMAANCKKVGPPPLVPIDNTTGEIKVSCLTGSDCNMKIKQERVETTTPTCANSIPTAISLSSVVSGLNIVSKPFDVESLMKPLTLHIDQSLQNIKETVDAKISGVVYIGAEEDKSTRGPSMDQNGSTFCESKSEEVKQSNVVSRESGSFHKSHSKESSKGGVVQVGDGYMLSKGSGERGETSRYVNATHDGACTLSPYIHTIHRVPHHMVRVESQRQCSRTTKHVPHTISSSVDATRSPPCSCSSSSSSNSSKGHQHYHHHHHANRHHMHHQPYYQRSHRHYHSSDGKVTMAPVAPIDPLVRKTQSSSHQCKKTASNGSAKLIDYHHIEH